MTNAAERRVLAIVIRDHGSLLSVVVHVEVAFDARTVSKVVIHVLGSIVLPPLVLLVDLYLRRHGHGRARALVRLGGHAQRRRHGRQNLAHPVAEAVLELLDDLARLSFAARSRGPCTHHVELDGLRRREVHDLELLRLGEAKRREVVDELGDARVGLAPGGLVLCREVLDGLCDQRRSGQTSRQATKAADLELDRAQVLVYWFGVRLVRWSSGCVLLLFDAQGCLGPCDVVDIELSEERQDLKVGEERCSGVDDLRQSEVGGVERERARTSIRLWLRGVQSNCHGK